CFWRDALGRVHFCSGGLPARECFRSVSRNHSRVSFAEEFSTTHAMKEATIDTHSKALKINLDPRSYGTFTEIGAGRAVVPWFFRVGGAAGTVAKSMSAYDMKV